MKLTSPFSAEYTELQRQWFEKEAQAASETKKTSELTNRFILELERLKNRNLN